MKKLKYIILLALIVAFNKGYSQPDTLEIVRIAMVDYDGNGMTDGFEVEFNQPVDDASFTTTDWEASNNFTFADGVADAENYYTGVKFIATANIANDQYATIYFNNGNGGIFKDDNYTPLYLRYTKGDFKAYYNDTVLYSTPSPLIPEDYCPPEITDVDYPASWNGDLYGVGDYVTIKITVRYDPDDTEPETDLVADTLIINNTYVPSDSLFYSSGFYYFRYWISDGDSYLSDGNELPISFRLADGNGNISETYSTSPAASRSGEIDGTIPVIKTVTVSPGHGTTAAVGEKIRIDLTVQTDANDPVLTASTLNVNSKDISSDLQESGGNYYVEYTVGPTDNEIDDILERLPIEIALSDGINTSTTFTQADFVSDVTPGVATASPEIDSVHFLPETGVLGIGDTITVILYAKDDETGLDGHSLTINGQSIFNESLNDNGDGSYTFEYIIEEGDGDVADNEKITFDFYLKDNVNNTPLFDETNITVDDCPGIDATRPNINSVAFPIGNGTVQGVLAPVYVDIDFSPNESGLSATKFIVNGKDISASFALGGTLDYRATLNIAEGDDDIDDGTRLPFSFIVSDGVNESIEYTQADLSSDITPGIDANSPRISTVVFSPGNGNTLGIGETVNIDIYESKNETLLGINTFLVNGIDVSASFTEDGGVNGLYHGSYTVAGTDTEIDDASKLPFTIILDDNINNSNTFTQNNLTADVTPGVDPTAPSISSVSFSTGNGNTLAIGSSLTLTVDAGGEENLQVETFEVNGIDITNTFSETGLGFYQALYTVQNTHTSIDDAVRLPFTISLTDGANSDTYTETNLASDLTPGVDAEEPEILSVELRNYTKKIGDEDTLYITITADADYNNYSLVSGKVGGFNIKAIEGLDNQTILALFDVTAKSYEIDSSETVTVSDLQLSDGAGNVTGTIDQDVNNDFHAIFSKRPVATLSGSDEVCDGDSTNTMAFLTGHIPFSITYTDNENAPKTINNIYDTYYLLNAIDKTNNSFLDFNITNVTDATGNSNVGSGTFRLNINDLPNVSITSPLEGEDIDISKDSVQLIGNQAEGVFSGNGVISTRNLFIPDIAGIDVHQIYYSYTDLNGCTNSDTVTVEVIDGGGIDFDPNKTVFCSYTDTFYVYGYNNLAVTGSFDLEGGLYPEAIVDLGNDTAIIQPSKLAAGSYNITYSYPGGEDIVKGFTVEEVATPSFTTIGNICADYETLHIEASDLNPLGGNGYFTLSDGLVNLSPTNRGNNITINDGDLTPDGQNPRAYKLEYYYISLNSCSSDTIEENFVVNPLPVVDITMETLYDINGGTHLITADPTIPAGEFSPSFMIDQNNGTAIFDPEIAGLGDKKAYYTYTDLNGCTNVDSAAFTVNEAEAVIYGINKFNSNNQYCYFNTQLDTIWAIASNGDGSAGTFTIDGVVVTNVVGTDSIEINPSDYSSGDHTLRFSYKNGSVNFYVEESFNIDSIGNLYFTGLDSEYCKDDNREITLTGIYQGNEGEIKFTGNGIADLIDDEFAIFNPSLANLGANTINYKFTRDYSGCYKNYTQNVSINKTPVVKFTLDKSCVVNQLDSVQMSAQTLVTDNVVEWEWRVVNTVTEKTKTEESPKFSLVPQNNNYVKLTLTTDKGCSAFKDSSIFIGSVVDLDFNWDKECHGEIMTFNVTEFTPSEGVDSVVWDFGGDGVEDLTNEYSPTYSYTNPGGYDVVYTEYTKTCGPISETKRINIRPSIQILTDGYFQDFETNPDATGWAVDILESTSNFTWEWGQPQGTKINSAAGGNNAFVTNLDGNYANDEKSYISSPCFDFSLLEKPMIRFDFISALELTRDGVILEYSVNKDEWNSVGVYGEGVMWYNSFSLNSNIIGQSSGWNGNGISLNASDASTWNNAKYWLDDMAGETGVRFRFSLGSDEFNTDEGFGFDNVWIGDRNRIVLLEHFANPASDDFANAQIIVENIFNDNSQDVFPVQYFTSFPSPNNISDFYTAGPSARSLYYGISRTPYSIVDGGDRKFNYASTNILESTDINKRMLEEAIFDIDVKQGISGDNLLVQASVKAKENIDYTKFSVKIVIVEKSVGDYINVIRTMLPDPAGSLLTQSWDINDSVNIYQSWELPTADVDRNNIAAVVFIQNEETKEVYQTAYTDLYSTITDIDDKLESPLIQDYLIYPNPVSNSLTIHLMNRSTVNMKVSVFNNAGVMLKTQILSTGSIYHHIDVEDLPQGIYYIRIEGNDKAYTTKKFIKD